MLLLLASLSLGIRPQAPSGAYANKIDFLERGAPLSKVIPRLAGATHLNLAVPDAMQKEVVCIDVHGVTVKELLDHLAEVTACSWVADRHGLLSLIPSASARAAERTADIALRAKSFEVALTPAKVKPKSEKYEVDTSAIMPEFDKLLRQIGVDALAGIPNDTRVVYSTDPTPMQQTLDASAFEVFAELTAAQNRAADEFNKQIEEIDNRIEANLPIGGGWEGWVNSIERVTLTPTKVLLVVERVDRPGTAALVNVQLLGYNGEGRAITPITPSLNWPEPRVEGVDGKPIELSPETRDLIRLKKAKGLPPDEEPSPPMPQNAEAAAMKLALDPESFDPLAYGIDLLRGLARAKACQLVACVPDEFMYMEELAGRRPMTPNAVMGVLQSDQEIDATFSDGWMCVKPRDSVDAEAARIDRKQMARLMSELQNDVHVKLDRMLELASAGMGPDVESPFKSRFELVTNPETFLGYAAEDWSMLRLYASLTGIQRMYLARNHEVSLGSLSEVQSALLAHTIYRPHDDSGAYEPHAGSYVELSVADDPRRQYGWWTPPIDYRTEPTEIAPNGLPRDGYIKLSESDETAILADQGKGPRTHASVVFSMPNTVQTVANRVALTLDPVRASTITYKSNRLSFGEKHTMDFRIYVAKDVYRKGQIFSYTFPDSKTYDFGTAPNDFKEAVKDAAERIKKRPPPRPPVFGPP